jgi:hypothetical protein
VKTKTTKIIKKKKRNFPADLFSFLFIIYSPLVLWVQEYRNTPNTVNKKIDDYEVL